MMLNRNSYAAGNFELQIDGQDQTAFVKSVDGGWSRATITDEQIGSTAHKTKQITHVEIEPIKVELGMMSATGMLKCIQASWNRQEYQRCNGQLTYADFNLDTMFEHQFHRALVTETQFPTLDGASKDGGYLTCTLQPEWVVTTASRKPGARIGSPASTKQKMWTPSAFRLNIDGVEEMQYANKIDGFSVKMQISKLNNGKDRLPELIPIKLQFPNITGTISLKYADPLLKWQQQFIRSMDGAGLKDTKAAKSGSLEFLTPDRKTVLMRINLFEVGLVYCGTEKSVANSDQIKRMKFELYVHGMTLDGSSQLGF